MSILSDVEIQNNLDCGDILIHPFNKKQLRNGSYDVCLGENYFMETPSKSSMLNIWNEKSVKSIWQKGSLLSKESLQQIYENDDFSDLPNDAKIILLEPGQSILGHTIEFIGGVKGITSQMFCRSSYGRCGILVCKCAGLGDAGYYTRWTMEITNINKYNSIPLVVGEPIAQIVFHKFNTLESFPYYLYGNYQNSSYLKNGIIDTESLINDWKPENMLPKLYKSKSWI